MNKLVFLVMMLFGIFLRADEAKLPEDSIYNIKSNWSNQNGDAITLDSLRGQNVIMTMVYTGCAHACPMTIAKVQEIEKALVQADIKNYKLVLASFDSVKDTPRVLKDYMKKRKISEDHWVFLSTAKDSVARELAVSLGISYKAIGDGDFSHSNVISYLDSRGVVKSKIESLTADITPLVASVKKEGL
ncbi:MAG: SCO family protein [Bdellovibrionaceae bacterium]|nr:SCO family protein [Pseudobdellovibrionaceae bacterium]